MPHRLSIALTPAAMIVRLKSQLCLNRIYVNRQFCFQMDVLLYLLNLIFYLFSELHEVGIF